MPLTLKRIFSFRYLSFLFIPGLFFLLLSDPAKTLDGAKSGLLLWFNTVLPTLLPFIIMSGLIVRTGTYRPLCRVTYPILKFFLPISRTGCYPLLTGLISGLPVGAKISADLLKRGLIGKKEAQYITAFTSIPSPAFLTGYVAVSCLAYPKLTPFIILIILLSAFLSTELCCRLFYKYFDSEPSALSTMHTASQEQTSSFFSKLDFSVSEGFEIILKAGGYIIMFSAISQHLPGMFLSGLLEITSGINDISVSALTTANKIVLTLTLSGFGGLSCLLQTAGFIVNSGLSLSFHIVCKVCSALFAFILSILLINII